MATNKEEKSELKIVYKHIDDLIPTEYNPKKSSPKQDEQIRASLQRFGFVDPIIVNINPDRHNIIVGGHQRTRIAKGMGIEQVPCVEVNLDLEREKELNVRLTKNTASIDDALLAMHFDKEMLSEIGFLESELKSFVSEFEEELSSYSNSNCAYPLVPKFSESHNAVIIVCHNDIDMTYLETVLGIDKAQSYKNTRVGKTSIITVDQFKDAMDNL